MNLSIKRAQKEAASLKVEHKIKVRVYTLIHELIQSNVTSKLLYGLLILIETAQFLWFMVHPRFTFLWTTDAANALRIPLKYLQFNAILELDNSVIFLVCLYSIIGIEIFIAVLIFIIMRAHNNHEKRNSTLLTYSIKIVSLFAMLMTTILVIPFFNVFIATFYCNNEDYVHGDMTCYSGVYIVHFAMAVIGVVLFFIYVVMFLPFFTDLNPWSTLPTASPMSIVPFGKLLMKIFCPAYFTIDFKGTLNVQFAAIAGIYWLIVCFFRYQALPYYDRNINRFILVCESVLLWSGGVLNIHAFLDLGTVDNIGLLFLVIAAPFISTTFVALVEKTYADVIHDDPKAIKKAEDMEVYIDTLIHLIEHRHDPVKRIKLEGVLKLYAIRNTKPDTVNACTKLIKANLKEDSQHKDELWYEWLEEILEEAIEKFEKGATLHLINAYLHQEKLENRFKALYELLLTDENKPEIQQEFAIFRYKNIIEEEIIEHDNNNSENKGIDVNLLVDFQNKFVDFQTHIEKSVSYHLDFWRELLEDNPDIQKLQNLSSKITNSVEEVAANFYKISEINNNHTKMLRIYGSFLRDIVNDDAEGRKLLEKAEYIEKTSSANRQFIDNERLKYGENSNTCIVTCNGNYSSIGSISNINNEITRILEFTKGELLGQNINRIMPKIIADSHDAFMKRYFETSESLVMGQERIVFPITKKGYLVPCSLMIKVLPTLDDGIKVVGFLKDLENESGKGLENDENVHYIMYGGENNLVFGISASCENSFGIPLNLLYGNGSANELSIDQILPELLTFAPDDLKNPNGFVTTLDSTTIQQNYHLGDNGSESGEEDGNTEIAEKFKKTRIRAVLIQDDKYKDINPLRVLKFVEAIEGDDNFAAVKKILPDTKDKVGFDETKPSQEVQNDHLGPSEDRSLSQGGGDESNLNEKTKQLKDAKTLISEKNVPRSIKFLRRVGFLVVLSWLAVACVNFAMSFLLHDEVAEGSYATYVAYGRYDVMANINYQLRKLQLLSQQVNTTTDAAALNATANVLRNSLVTLIDNMQTLQFEVIKANIKMQRRSSTTLPDQVVTVESLLANTIKYDTANLTDALFTYLSQASTVRNSSLASFSDSSATEQTQKNFYAVRRNGLGSLRNGSQAAAEQFYDFYSDKTDYYKTVFLILAIVAIFVMFVGNAFSMPIVSSMHQTNKEVLSMFGYISTDEINDLAVKCERFIIDHLEDRADKKDYSLDLEEGREKDDDDKKEEDPLLKKKVDSGDNSAIDDAIDNNPRTPIRRKITNGSSPGNSGQKGSMVLDNNNDDKINMNNEEAEELIDQAKVEEIKFTRSQKLMNSRKNQNKSDIMKFFIVTAIYVGGSLGYFFYQHSQVNNCQTAFEHLKLVSQGIPFIRYINVYTLEELAENSTTSVYSYVLGSTSTTFNSRKYFISEVQDNERDISDSEKKGFPSQFDSYKDEYGSLYLGNLCQTYYTDDADAETCENVLDALLDQGLKVGINTIISNSIDIMNEFYASDRSATSQAAFINSTEFVSSEDILTEIVPPLEDLLTSYYSAFGDFVDQSLNISRIWFSLAVTFLFFTLVFLWLPFLKRLRDDIWRTKGMLNMIPMEIISKNENLSEKFTNGELTKAVQ